MISVKSASFLHYFANSWPKSLRQSCDTDRLMSSELDTKLGAILDIIKKSIETSKTGTGTGASDIATQPSAGSVMTPSPTNAMNATELQKIIANEMIYHQLLPPVTPELAQKVEHNVQLLIDNLKQIAKSPYMTQLLMNYSMEIAKTTAPTERSLVPDSDFGSKELQEALRKEIERGGEGERILPLLAVAVEVVVYASAGVTVGTAAGYIAGKIFK